MDSFNVLEVFLILYGWFSWSWDEEGIVSISGRVSLGLEERVEVPERAFYVSAGIHFLEAHLSQNFNELLASLHQMMEISILELDSFGCWIEFLEFYLLPWVIN